MDARAAGTTLAIMQPYFLPYIGYWQLIAAVDTFVIYDNIKFTKKGWINRNRLLRNGEAVTFSLPVAAGSDHLDVVERSLAPSHDRRKLLAQFDGAYAKAPHYAETRPLLEEAIQCPEENLYRHIRHAVDLVCRHLGLDTRIVVSSQVPIDHGLKAQDKVLALCEALGARTYVNPIGGTELYDANTFAARGIALKFMKARLVEYPQLGAPFVPWLSIVDVLAFNPLPTVQDWVRTQFDFV